MFDLLELRPGDSGVARLLGYVPNTATGVFDALCEQPPGRWAGQDPGPATAAGIAGSTEQPARLSDAEVLDAIVAAERLLAWTRAQQVALLAEFARRRPGDDPTAAGSGTPDTGSRWAPDEIALALRQPRVTARAQLLEAVWLREELPATWTALAAAAITAAQAAVLVSLLHTLPPDLVRQVEARVLPQAHRQTLARFKATVRYTVARVDPEGANRRHQQANKQRRVSVQPAEEGMSTLWALLPATDAAAVWQTLTRLAHGLGPDDPRPLDARRADLLVDLLVGRLTLTDLRDAGWTPSPRATKLTDLDNIASSDTAATTSDPATEDATDTAAAPPLPGFPPTGRRPKQGPGRAPRPPSTALVHVVVGYDTLTGHSQLPGELAGYGPIPADLARTAALDATWKRLITDPLSGALLDHGRRTYRPPAALADYIIARDLECRFPTCRRRATDTDLDHRQPWSQDGTTDPTNLHALCRHHHTLKEQPGWHVTLLTDGSLIWTTPTGSQHVSRPHDHRRYLSDREEAPPPATAAA